MGKLLVAPGVAPGNRNIYKAAKVAVKSLPFDVVIVSWFRPGAIVAGTNTPSRHAAGRALDMRSTRAKVIPSGGPCANTEMLDEQGMKDGDQIAAIMREAGFATVIWRSCQGGNHYNHVHADNGGVTMHVSGSVQLPDNVTGVGGAGDVGTYNQFDANGIPIVGPIVKTYQTVGDVIGFLSEEHGLLRIAEVILGFGLVALGVTAMIVDSAGKSKTIKGGGKALLPVAAVLGSLKMRNEANENDRQYEAAQRNRPSGGDPLLPENAVIPGSSRPRRSKQSESARVNKVMAAQRKATQTRKGAKI